MHLKFIARANPLQLSGTCKVSAHGLTLASALVTPIHKKGCTLDTANDRPIAVGEPLYRLYTIVLNRRLVDWSEEHQLRSPTQAGFRPRQFPIHHLFALRHVIDNACIAKRPLYACFVDLQKAYDTVEHDMLWSKLESIGVGPHMLAAIQSLYSCWDAFNEGGWHSWAQAASVSADGHPSGLSSEPYAVWDFI